MENFCPALSETLPVDWGESFGVPPHLLERELQSASSFPLFERGRPPSLPLRREARALRVERAEPRQAGQKQTSGTL